MKSVPVTVETGVAPPARVPGRERRAVAGPVRAGQSPARRAPGGSSGRERPRTMSRRGGRHGGRHGGRRGGRADRRRGHEGFTLVELAVVIAIVGLLLGTFLGPLRAQIDAARVRETERLLGDVRDALIGHAIARGALPCPDVVADGIDGAAPAACTGAALEGVLPYQALGVPRADAWGRLFRYRVTEEFTNRLLTGQPPGAGRLDLTDTGDITVLTRGDDPGTGGTAEIKHQSVATALTRTAPAVVFSTGPNGLGGIGAATGPRSRRRTAGPPTRPRTPTPMRRSSTASTRAAPSRATTPTRPPCRPRRRASSTTS